MLSSYWCFYFSAVSVAIILCPAGPVHGALFLFFVINALRVSIEQQWEFKVTTWKILVACFIPFGTFYIDYKILRYIQTDQN
ncbi:DUF3817 domain-containing protein [Pontibacter sp. SGAir0037]|uniref:DUF3817 domain-containing protein n=1 Tax=Pontibacter sp. SGAir0037 TaxID=2571030 RepID=UPI00352A0DD1